MDCGAIASNSYSFIDLYL